MNCPNCGYKNRRGVKFCESCGYDFSSAPAPRGKSTVFCVNCGSKNGVGSRFCFKCGNALEGVSAPAQAGPQVVVIQQPERRRNWWGLLALLLLLLFGCALISSLVQVTPAMARNLPEFLQQPAVTFGRWQQEADILRRVRQGTTWVTTAWNDIFGGAQTARQQNNTADDQQFDEAPPEVLPEQPDMDQSDDQAACLDYSNVKLTNDTLTDLYWDYYGGSFGSGPTSFVFGGLPNNTSDRFGVQFQIGTNSYQEACWISSADQVTCDGLQNFADLGVKISQVEKIRFVTLDNFCADVYFPIDSLLVLGGSLTSSDQGGDQETSGPPMISVSQNTMCRKGPGNEYDAIGDLQVGETAEIVAQYSGGDYWVIENYGASGTCWLYGGYAQISGETSSLPYWEAPAPPVAAEPEPEDEPEEEVAGTITFTFNNNLDYASVCSVWVSSVSSSGWGSNLLGGCLTAGESAVITIPNEGSKYDLKASVCVEGCSDYFEMNITITPGASYPFKPY